MIDIAEKYLTSFLKSAGSMPDFPKLNTISSKVNYFSRVALAQPGT
jgi:hypothetical protein